MGKIALYYDEAERLYVREGFSLDAIVGMLGKNVARKTLFNWKRDHEWEEKRKKYLEETRDLRTQLREIAELCIKEAQARPTPKNLLAMCRAISALKNYDGMSLLENETTSEDRGKIVKELTPETLDYIKKAIYGLP